jgi:hypothetical protein
VAGLVLIRLWGVWLRRPPSDAEPDQLRKLWRAVGLVAGSGATALTAHGWPVWSLPNRPPPSHASSGCWPALGGPFIVTVILVALAAAIAAPRSPQWRLVALDDRRAALMFHFAAASALILAINMAAQAIAEASYLPIEFTIGRSATAALLLIVTIAGMLVATRPPAEDGGTRRAGPADAVFVDPLPGATDLARSAGFGGGADLRLYRARPSSHDPACPHRRAGRQPGAAAPPGGCKAVASALVRHSAAGRLLRTPSLLENARSSGSGSPSMRWPTWASCSSACP